MLNFVPRVSPNVKINCLELYLLTAVLLIDCETCFTIFYKNASPRSVNNQQDRTTQEVRLSILQFQQQMDAQDKLMVTPPITPIQDQPNYMAQNTNEFDDLEYEQYKSDKKRAKQENNTTPFSDHPSRREINDSVLGKIAHKLFFTTPKPLRPQLHAFF